MRWPCFVSCAMESHHRLYLLPISVSLLVKCRDQYHALDDPFVSHAKMTPKYLLDAIFIPLSGQVCPAIDL